MLRFFKLILIVPLAILFLAFAFANRHIVTVAFDPFPSGDIPAFALQMPLFVALILAAMLGVVAGGFAVWLTQGRHRRALRALRADTDKLRSDLAAAKAATPPVVALAKRA